MLPSLPDYERLVYTLQAAYPSVECSTLVVIRRGLAFTELSDSLEFPDDIVLRVWEDLNFARGVIQAYSYAVEQAGQRLYWYDPQPHPNDPTLSGTFPHHKHIPPDIKHHRVPARWPESDRLNLPFLIEEIEHDWLGLR